MIPPVSWVLILDGNSGIGAQGKGKIKNVSGIYLDRQRSKIGSLFAFTHLQRVLSYHLI